MPSEPPGTASRICRGAPVDVAGILHAFAEIADEQQVSNWRGFLPTRSAVRQSDRLKPLGGSERTPPRPRPLPATVIRTRMSPGRSARRSRAVIAEDA